MGPKRIKGYAWLPMLMLLFIGFIADMACASIGGKDQPLPVENDLLQFKAGSHIMGFKPDKVYLVNTAGFLSVEFLGAHTVSPKAATADANQPEKDVALTPDSGNTLANLQRVEYHGLWDGINLRYDAAKDGVAESTYFIQPGADVAAIQLRYNTDTELQNDGSLKIKLPTQQGYITESRPVAWQILDGKKKPVQVAYEIKDGAIGFKTGEYDNDHELIIDPTYQWHTFYGSSPWDSGNAIAVDGSGNVYVTGDSSNTWGQPLHAHSGDFDIVVFKLDSSGALVWNTFYGSSLVDQGLGIAVDGSGNIYVTGYSYATWGSPLHTNSGDSDIVVMKLDSSGVLVWNTFYGSGTGYGIAVDGSGYVYVTGSSDYSDIVVIKLDSSGALVWNTFYGSAGVDVGGAIAVDGSGNVYVAGLSDGTWGSSPLHAHSGDYDIVAFKLDSSGGLAWNTFYGSAGTDHSVEGIAVDGSGNVYVTGESDTTWGSPLHEHSGGGDDTVVFKLDGSGVYQWHTFYGTSQAVSDSHGEISSDQGYGIAVDGSGNVYVTGRSIATWGSPLHAYSGGDWDIVVFKLDSSGALVWNTFYGSSWVDQGFGIAVDGSGNVYVTGESDTTWGSPLHAYSSGDHDRNIMILKLDPYSTLTITKSGSGSGTVTSTPSGINCGTDCIEGYSDNTAVSLTATPAARSTFTGWSGDCAGGTSPVSVLVNGGKTCTATFSNFPWPMFLPAITKGIR